MYEGWTGRTFGAELEVLGMGRNTGAMTPTLLRRGLRQHHVSPINPQRAGYYHSTGQTWDVKTDSSCGFEVATPALMLDTEGGNDMLRAGMAGLVSAGAMLNQRCSTHVHVDAHDLDWRGVQMLIALWRRYEPFFFACHPAHRRANGYCPSLRGADWSGTLEEKQWVRAMLAATNPDAFRANLTYAGRSALNVSGWWRHGRVEIRMGSATLNYDNLRYWTTICLSLVNRVRAVATRNAPPIPLALHQPKPELGFSARYVLNTLGLVANRWTVDVPAHASETIAWAQRRIRAFRNVANTGYDSHGLDRA